jgi:hypothetical protein
MNIILTEEEAKFLDKVLGTVIYNGNHITQKVIETTPEDYRLACKIFSNLHDNWNIQKKG